MKSEDVKNVLTEEFSLVIDEYVAADRDEVIESLLLLRETIFERLEINE